MFAVYDQACGAPILVMPRWDERLALHWIRERELPRTPAGKLAVRRLRERYWQGQGRRI